MPQPDQFSTRVFALAVAAILAYLLFVIFSPFFGPIYWAFLLAFMLFPLEPAAEEECFASAGGLAAAAMTIGVALGIAIPTVVGAAAFARQAIELGSSLSRLGQRYQINGVDDLLRLPVIGSGMTWLELHTGIDAARVQALAVQGSPGRGPVSAVAQPRPALRRAGARRQRDPRALHPVLLLPGRGRSWRGAPSGSFRSSPGARRACNEHLQAVTRAVVVGHGPHGPRHRGPCSASGSGSRACLLRWSSASSRPWPRSFPLVGTALIWVPASLYLLAQGVAWKTIFLVVVERRSSSGPPTTSCARSWSRARRRSGR